MIKIINKLSSLSTSQCHYQSFIRFFTSNVMQTTTYPYLFGGLKNSKFIQDQTSFISLKEIFDEDTLEGFK